MAKSRSRPSGSDRPDDAVDVVVDRVCASRKYRSVHPDTVRDIVVGQVACAQDGADLERLARLRLHRAAAYYLSSAAPAALLADLAAGRLDGASDDDVRAWCRRAMATHVSAAERLPDLEAFYPTLLQLMGAVSSMADLACALNVLTLPWLREQCPTPYVGYDFNLEVIALGRRFAEIVDGGARMVHADVLVNPAMVAEDAALLLKTYHCLEARERGGGLRLVESLAARVVVVSLPTRTRSGRPLGFRGSPGEQLGRRAGELGWTIRKATLPTEELWAIFKRPVDAPER